MLILKFYILWKILYFKRFTVVYQLHILLHFFQTSDSHSSKTTEEYFIYTEYKHVDNCVSTKNTVCVCIRVCICMSCNYVLFS